MNTDKQDKRGTFTGKHADVTEKIIQAFGLALNKDNIQNKSVLSAFIRVQKLGGRANND
jgi:hypothetical protein